MEEERKDSCDSVLLRAQLFVFIVFKKGNKILDQCWKYLTNFFFEHFAHLLSPPLSSISESIQIVCQTTISLTLEEGLYHPTRSNVITQQLPMCGRSPMGSLFGHLI